MSAGTTPKKVILHTPGPWRVDGYCGTMIGTEGDPYGHGPMRIADVRGWGHLTGGGACHFEEDHAIDIQNANARLIAAAPDLLEALKAMVSSYDGLRDTLTSPVVLDKLKRSEAAIAKAEGR